MRVREVLSRFEDSPERQNAVRLAADRLDLPKETQAGFAPGKSGRATGGSLRGCWRRARDSSATPLPGVAAHPGLLPLLSELAPEHFDAELHRRARAHLLEPGEPDAELVPCWQNWTRGPPPRGSTTRPAKELLLRLRERQVKPGARGRRPRADERAPGAARGDPRDGRDPDLDAATIRAR